MMKRRLIISTCFFALFLFLPAAAVAQGEASGSEPATPPAEAQGLEDFESLLFPADAPEGGDAAEGLPELDGFPDTSSFDSGSPEEERTEYLLGGSVSSSFSASFPLAADYALLSASLAGKAFAKVSVPRAGILYASYAFSHAPFQGFFGDGPFLPASDPFTPLISLSELHYSFDLGKFLFVRLGNQLVAWGPGRIWTPVDFVNLKKADAFSTLDARAGKPALRLHLPLSFGNIFAIADFASLLDQGPGGIPSFGDALEGVNLGARLDFTALAFEFGLSGYGGAQSPLRLGFDASGRLLGATVFGEAAWGPAYEAWQGSFQASGGISLSLGELRNWILSLEGFYNSRGADLSSLDELAYLALPEEDKRALYQGMYYAYGALQTSDLFRPGINASLSVLSNLSDLSYLIRLGPSFDVPGLPPFSMDLSFAGGGEGKEFTRFSGNNVLALGISSRLEF